MQKKLKIGFITALITVLAVSAVAAQGFHLIWNAVPFEPNNYSWQEPWEVHEMVDFVDAQLTITGCSYEGQNHNIELIIANVANTPDYYLLAFTYSAKWYVDETNQENIIAGTYSGDALAVDDFVTYTDAWVPTVIGVGVVKLNLIDIVWAQSEPITWTTDSVITHTNAEKFSILSFEITGATMSNVESGTVSFSIHTLSTLPATEYHYKVEVVEASITIAEGTDTSSPDTTKDYSFNFDPIPIGGSLTMRLTISNP